MSTSGKAKVGTIGWVDLTVENAEEVRDFYKAVVGWESSELDMGGYSDSCMIAPGTETTVAGVCHSRGANVKLPPVWIVYIFVENLDLSLAKCVELGGSIIDGPRSMGEDRFAIIRDPAGAVCALYESKS
jgi:hypothetical protein